MRPFPHTVYLHLQALVSVFWWVLVLVIEYLDKKLIKSFHELILPVMFRYFGVWTTVEDVA